METPTVIINLKTYEQGSGDGALEMAYVCDRVAAQEDASVAVAVQNADMARIAPRVDVPVLAQHVDPAGYGSHTGSDVAETLAYNGADGVLINHSEDQASLDVIEGSVDRAHDAGLETVVCVDAPELAETVSKFKPDYVAFEPPELIGGDTSVSTAQPELVEEAVDRSSRTVLCGAGVKDADDVAAALELGTAGVLVASGVVKAADPAAALRDLVSGMQR